jgi:tetratricopeptide (TPR) repeat protein
MLGGVVVVLAGWAAYSNSFAGPFLFDDLDSIPGNPTIRHLSPIWSAMWAPPSAGSAGRPLLNLSFALNYAFGGLNVWGYHVLNLAIHLLAGLTLFGIVRRTLQNWVKLPAVGAGQTPGLSPAVPALAVALLWTLHPLQTEAVSYVSQRAESLMGLFYLLTLYAFIRYAEEGKTRQAVFSIVFYLLGVASKEMIVTAPVAVLLYDRTFVSGTFREAGRRRWKYYALLASPWLLLGYQLSGVHARGAGLNVGGSWWDYALMEGRVVLQYLGLAIWPYPLVFDYGRGVDAASWAEAPYVVAVLLLVAGVAWLLFRPSPPDSGGRAVGFAGAWFFLVLAPTSSVVAVSNLPMAEHRLYVPLAGVIAVVALGIYRWLGSRSVPVWLALAAAAGALTAVRNEDYRTALRMWTVTAEQQPENARVQTNLGQALEAAGRPDEAEAHFAKAIQLRPDYAEGHFNQGNFLLRQNRPAEAVEPCEAALRLKPDYPQAHYVLGVALLRLGREEAAFEQFAAALRVQPDYVDVHHTLAGALAMSGRMDEALAHYEIALRLQPGEPFLQIEMANVLARMGRSGEAMAHYQAAERIAPGSLEVHFAIGNALFELRRFQEAADQYAAAVRISPDFADARNNLGNSLAELGRFDEAQAQYEAVLQLRPGDEQARSNLALLRSSRAENSRR